MTSAQNHPPPIFFICSFPAAHRTAVCATVVHISTVYCAAHRTAVCAAVVHISTVYCAAHRTAVCAAVVHISTVYCATCSSKYRLLWCTYLLFTVRHAAASTDCWVRLMRFFLIRLIIENEDNTFLRNVRKYSLNDVACHPRRPEPSYRHGLDCLLQGKYL